MSEAAPDVRGLLRRLADLPEQDLRVLLHLVEQAAPPDSGENLLIAEPIILGFELSGVLVCTPPDDEVESAASLWEDIRPRTPEQGIAWVTEFRKLLQALILLVGATAAAIATAQDVPPVGPPAPAESGQSSADQP